MKKTVFAAALRSLRLPFIILLSLSFLGGLLSGLLLMNEGHGAWLRTNGLLYEGHGIVVTDTEDGIRELPADTFSPAVPELPVGRHRLGLAAAICSCLTPLFLFFAFSYLFRAGGARFTAALPCSFERLFGAGAAAAWLLSLPALVPAALIPFLAALLSPYLHVEASDLAAVFLAACVNALYLDGLCLLALSEAARGEDRRAPLLRVLLLLALLLVAEPIAVQGFGFSLRQHCEAFAEAELTNRMLTARNLLPLRLFWPEALHPGAGALLFFAANGLLYAVLGLLRFRLLQNGREDALPLFLLLLCAALLLVTGEYTTNATTASRVLLGSLLILAPAARCLIGRRLEAEGGRTSLRLSLRALLEALCAAGLFALLVELASRS